MTNPPTPRDREVPVSDANEAGNWGGILATDEQIEWQGAPVRGLRWELGRRETLSAFAAAAGGIALFALAPGKSPNMVKPILLFLAWFLAWGIIAAVVFHAWSLWNRRRTCYTLTSQRAFIETWHFGVQTLRAYPIATMRPLRLVDTRPGHVYFDHDTVQRKNRWTGTYEDAIVKVGFVDLDDPRSVHDLLLRLGAVPG